MRRIAVALGAAGLALSLVAAGPAADDPPEGYQFEMELVTGETVTHEGPSNAGGTTAGSLFGLGPDRTECTQDSSHRCDKGLAFSKVGGTVTFELTPSIPGADFDVFVYESDKDGNLGEEVASAGNLWFPVSAPFLSPTETGTFEAKRGGYYAIFVDYYAAGGGYTLDVVQE